MFDNTSGGLSNNLGLGDGALTQLTTGANNVAVGYNTLQTTTTGSSNVAIGNLAASNGNHSNTITINAAGISVDPTAGGNCFVAPIRNATAANALYYDNTTKEITWDASGGTAPSGGGNSNFVGGNLFVSGTAEAKGLLLPQVTSAEGRDDSIITNLNPHENPLMTKGMIWMKKDWESISAEWENQASFDISNIGMGAAALDGKIYTVGGQNYNVPGGGGGWTPTNIVSVYNPTTNNWGGAVPLDISAVNPAVATLDGKLYAVGGAASYARLRTGQVYGRGTIPEGTWAYGTPQPYSQYDGGTAVLGGKLYIMGGGHVTQGSNNAVYAYLPSSTGGSGTWTASGEVASLPTNRVGGGAAALMGKIYLVGGTAVGSGGSGSDLTTVYDPSTNTWEDAAPQVARRLNGHGVAALGGKLYAVGGYQDIPSAQWVRTGAVYNPPPAWGGTSLNASGDWAAIADMNEVRGKFGLVAAGAKLYAVGGSPDGGYNNFSSVEVYDPIDDSWEMTAPMEVPRRNASVMVFGGQLYAAGGVGGNGNSPLNTMEVYDLTYGRGWRTISTDIGGARSDAGGATLGEALYIVGGAPGGAVGEVRIYTPPLDILKFGGFASMSTRRFQQWGAVLMGKLYVGGGRVPNLQGNTVSPSTTEVYDPITDMWSYVAPLPAIGHPTSGYYGSTAVSLGGKLYVMGGSPAGQGGWQTHVHAYDPSENTWTQRASMWVGLSSFGAAALFGKIYATTFSGGSWKRVQVYDPSTNSWTWAADTLNMWVGCGAAALLGKLYVCGGTTGGNPTNKAEVYDPPIAWGGGSTDPSGTWSEIANLNTARMLGGNQVTTLGGKLYVVGGQVLGQVYTNTIEVYDPLTPGAGWQTLSVHVLHHPFQSVAVGLLGSIYSVGGLPNVGGQTWSTDVPPSSKSITVADPHWEPIADMNTAREAAAAVGMGGRLYVAGGTDGNVWQTSVECFDPATNTWETAASMIERRIGFGLVSLGGKLFAAGGASSASTSGSNSYAIPRVEVYEPPEAWGGVSTDPGGTWSQIAAMNYPRWFHGLAVMSDKLYAVGSKLQSASTLNITLSIETYDPTTDIWTLSEEMPEGWGQGGAASVGNTLYVMGGAGGSGPGSVSKNSMISYPAPISLLSFNSIADATQGRFNAWGATLMGKVYMGWGCGDTNENYTDTHYYDPSENTWTLVTGSSPAYRHQYSRWTIATTLGAHIYVLGGAENSAQTPDEICSFVDYMGSDGVWHSAAPLIAGKAAGAAVTLGGKIYEFGGYGHVPNSTSWLNFNTMNVYDPSSDNWTALAPMLTARAWFGGAELLGKIYALGGADGTTSLPFYGQTNAAEVYDPVTNAWSSIASLESAHVEGQAFGVRGKLYAIGGRRLADTNPQTDPDWPSGYEVFDPANPEAGWETLVLGGIGKYTFFFQYGFSPAYAEMAGDMYVMSGGTSWQVSDMSHNCYVSSFSNESQWKERANWPAQQGLGAWAGGAAIGGKIYICGGGIQEQPGSDPGTPMGTRKLWCYNPIDDSWDDGLAPMDISRVAHGCAALGGKLYAVGGSDATPGGGGGIPVTAVQSSAEVYDPILNTWSPIADLNRPRFGCACAALGGKLYVTGGLGRVASGQAPATFRVPPCTMKWSEVVSGSLTSSIYAEVYDPRNGSWNTCGKPMPVPVMDHACVAIAGKLWVVGGTCANTYISFQFASSRWIQVYDPIGGCWYASPDTAWNGLGQDWTFETHQPYNFPYIASTGGTDSGSAADDPSINLGTWGIMAAAVDGKLFLMGGFSGGSLAGSSANPLSVHRGAYYYDTTTIGTGDASGWSNGQWANNTNLVSFTGAAAPVALPFMDVSRGHGVAVVCGGKIYVIGGLAGGSNGPMVNNVDFALDAIYPSPVSVYTPAVAMTPQITYQGEDFYLNATRGGPPRSSGFTSCSDGTAEGVWNALLVGLGGGGAGGLCKTFVIPHPEHEGKMLRHACMEAPTRGTNVYICQFEATESSQTTTIALPSYFQHINGRARVYVYPKNVLSTCYGNVNDDLTFALITTEKPGTFNVMITGVRKDPSAVAYSATEHIDEPIAVEDIPSVQK